MGLSGCDLDHYWLKVVTGVRGTTTDCSKIHEQLDMRKKIGFMLKWIRHRVNNTLEMFHLPTFQDEYAVDTSALVGRWTDGVAKKRAGDLQFYMSQAQIVLDDPEGLLQMWNLQDIYKWLFETKIEPKGYPFKEDWVCNEFMSHSLPSAKFDCHYTAQKSGVGYDLTTNSVDMYFREGCFCKINWQGGCPYNLHHWPTYLDFGFRDLEEKFVTNKDPPMKFTENYLCWYWSHPDMPFWGYLGHPSHYFPDGAYDNAFECKYPRSPDQPCSTMRFWEWDIKASERMTWNKASAYHPREVMP